MYSYPQAVGATTLGAAMGAPTVFGGSLSAAPGTVLGGSLTVAPGITTTSPMTSPRATMNTVTPLTFGGTQTYAAPVAMPTSPMTSPRGVVSYGGSLTVAPGGGSLRAAPGGVQMGGVQMGGVPMWTAPPAATAMAPPNAMSMPQLPQAPGWTAPTTLVSTEGMPNPQQVATQQAAYIAALDKQLADGVATLEKERELEKQMLKFTAEKDVALYTNQAMERLVEQSALVDERMTFQILELKKAAVERKLQLAAQAQGLTMDYEMKSVQAEWQQKRTQFEQQYLKAEGKLEAEYAKQVAIANTGTAYAPTMPLLR